MQRNKIQINQHGNKGQKNQLLWLNYKHDKLTCNRNTRPVLLCVCVCVWVNWKGLKHYRYYLSIAGWILWGTKVKVFTSVLLCSLNSYTCKCMLVPSFLSYFTSFVQLSKGLITDGILLIYYLWSHVCSLILLWYLLIKIILSKMLLWTLSIEWTHAQTQFEYSTLLLLIFFVFV